MLDRRLGFGSTQFFTSNVVVISASGADARRCAVPGSSSSPAAPRLASVSEMAGRGPRPGGAAGEPPPGRAGARQL